MITISLENGTTISIENSQVTPYYQRTETLELVKAFESADAFVSADYHLCKYFLKDKSSPEYKQYILDTEKCIELHNKRVGKDDIVLFLGDLTEEEFGELSPSNPVIKEVKNKISKLNGKIIMLTGNNDSFGDNFYKSLGIQCVLRLNEISKGTKNVYSHYPVNVSGGKLNIHGHIHGSKKYWSIDYKNHIDCYWKLWDGPMRISEFENAYNSGKYTGCETINVDANAIEELGENAGYDQHK